MLWKLPILFAIWTIGGILATVTYFYIRAARFAKKHGTPDDFERLFDNYINAYSSASGIKEEDGLKEAVDKVRNHHGGMAAFIAQLLKEGMCWPITLIGLKAMCDEYEASKM